MTFEPEFERQDHQGSQELLISSDKFYNKSVLVHNFKNVISDIELNKDSKLILLEKKQIPNQSTLTKPSLSVKKIKSTEELELSGFQPELNQSLGLSFNEFDANSNFLYDGPRNTNFKSLGGSQQQLNISAIPFSTRSNHFSTIGSTKNFGFNSETKRKNNCQDNLPLLNDNENEKDLRVLEVSPKCSNNINQQHFRSKVFMQGLFFDCKESKERKEIVLISFS